MNAPKRVRSRRVPISTTSDIEQQERSMLLAWVPAGTVLEARLRSCLYYGQAIRADTATPGLS